MKTLRKSSLFILWVLICGCPKETPTANPPSERPESEEANSEAALERDCFDGDPEACDRLGH